MMQAFKNLCIMQHVTIFVIMDVSARVVSCRIAVITATKCTCTLIGVASYTHFGDIAKFVCSSKTNTLFRDGFNSGCYSYTAGRTLAYTSNSRTQLSVEGPRLWVR